MTRVLGIFLILINCFFSIKATNYQCNITSACGCSIAQTSVTSRIVGGEATQSRAWKWIVSLRYRNSHTCGATLISNTYAVTAAHCVEGRLSNPALFSILAGTDYLTGSLAAAGQTRTVRQIYMHPSYDPSTYANDIALLRFDALTLSSLTYICLPTAGVDPFSVTSDLVAIGWGVTNQNSNTVSNYLQQVTVQTFSSSSADCVRGGIADVSTQFCAGVAEGGKDTCQGDSGGPLMAFSNNRWVLAGVTSSGQGCANAGYPGIYTRVSTFISYITSIVNGAPTGEVTATGTTPASVTTTRSGIQGAGAKTIFNPSILGLVLFFFLFFK